MVSETVEFLPEWAASPGLTIAHALEERAMTYDQLADVLHLPKRFVVDLVAGRKEITAELAEALAQAVGSTRRFWLAREKDYRASLDRLVRQSPHLAEWASTLPLQDMRRLGWIQKVSGPESVADCLQFFGVSSLERWKQTFERAVVAAAFRSTAAYKTNAASLSAWLRQGELEASAIKCKAWDPAKFQACLAEVRKLTRIKSPNQFVPAMQSLCSQAGVAVVVVPAPDGCRASGAARFLTSNHALIQLSRRYGTDDQFWFTFFHEAGHLLLHPKVELFIDEEDVSETLEEAAANRFASGILLTRTQRARLAHLPLTYRDVIRFAREVGLSPGIIVGQLQHSKRIGYERLSKAKRKFDWAEFDD